MGTRTSSDPALGRAAALSVSGCALLAAAAMIAGSWRSSLAEPVAAATFTALACAGAIAATAGGRGVVAAIRVARRSSDHRCAFCGFDLHDQAADGHDWLRCPECGRVTRRSPADRPASG